MCGICMKPELGKLLYSNILHITSYYQEEIYYSTYYSIKKVTSLYYYITLLLSKVIILCNLVTSYLNFTNEHVCRTLLLRKQEFYI